MAGDPSLEAHKKWIGYLQPVGLVVSPAALVAAQAFVDSNIAGTQRVLAALVAASGFVPNKQGDYPDETALHDLPRFFVELCGWEPADVAGGPGGPELPSALDVSLREYDGDLLRPSFAVPDPDKPGAFLLLVQTVPPGTDLDAARDLDHRWSASPEARFERLLREDEISIGLLSNGTHLRLVYAPRGESSGHLTFPIKAMLEVAGRPILSALRLLLEPARLFTGPAKQRLGSILVESRKYQNEVSTRLAEQILGALNDLLRGFQAADEAARGELLREVLKDETRQEVYGALLTTLLRLVFILYAEDRALLSTDPLYTRNYAVAALFERLREDAAHNPDTMDQRHGAWAQLLTLFRMIHDGAEHGAMRLPEREGRLFNPDAYPFLEGRPHRTFRVIGDKLSPPKVSDGTIYRVLEKLLLLDGERLSYRALDVEQIGSVYEAMMGFAIEVARGPSIGVGPHHVVVDLGALLKLKGEARTKFLAEDASCKLTGKAIDALKKAATVEDLVAAIGKRVSPRTPNVLPAGAMFLQPTEERRRSGSHYTPRALTEPIVRTTLRPVLEALGENPSPEQLLDLKVCDPAMGSGAFLVEACRQLGDALVSAWGMHKNMPSIPPEEDPVLHARRLVAQKCLYGVDKNPFAVDLAKLSIWLVTLAKGHPFTFVDHAFRQGDSLVGLSREQIASFHWAPEGQITTLRKPINEAIKKAEGLRGQIHALGDSDDTGEKQRLLLEADEALDDVRMIGDLVIRAYFSEEKDAARKKARKRLGDAVLGYVGTGKGKDALEGEVEALRGGERPVTPFHWEVEFPEVFSRANPGFDCFVGNPPFLGGALIWSALGSSYPDWIRSLHPCSGGKAVDLVAHFYRRAFVLIRDKATFGFLATNTIAQGDTRIAGLKYIRDEGGVIYQATVRLRWPGAAAVVVSVVFVRRGGLQSATAVLDDRNVTGINSYLVPTMLEFDPRILAENNDRCFQGASILGMGFTFDDTDKDGLASSLGEMHALLERDKAMSERIRPFIGGKELNSDPRQLHHRYVIDFGDLTLDEAAHWPALIQIVRERVKPDRDKMGGYGVADRRRENWWQFGTATPALGRAKQGLTRLLALARVSQHSAFAFLSSEMVFSEQLLVFTMDSYSAFSVLQARSHELWARFFGSSMKDDLRYTPSDCFETFPFPPDWEQNPALEAAGKAYYDFRAALMIAHEEGLTTTYNRFHSPDEHDPGILELRALHAAMDRAVLDAYGWTDLTPTCDFLLDYEEPEDEDEETGKRKKKKPWRYRWPDELRDEVLARLIALNQRRAEEEAAGER